jgi:hypothetical protein
MENGQRATIGDAVDTEHDRLPVDHELAMLALQRGLDDPGIAVAPVHPASAEDNLFNVKVAG